MLILGERPNADIFYPLHHIKMKVSTIERANQNSEYFNYGPTLKPRPEHSTNSNKQSSRISSQEKSLRRLSELSGSQNNPINSKSQSKTSLRQRDSQSSTNMREYGERVKAMGNQAASQRQNAQLKRQIARLEKENSRKDQQLLDMKSALMPSSEAHNQLVEVYRCLHYYEGKTKQMESELYKFRELIINSGQSINPQNLSTLFDELIRDNQQLHAELEETKFVKWNLQSKYKKMESKYYQVSRELLELKRRQASPLMNLDPTLTRNLSNNQFQRFAIEFISKAKYVPPSLNMELKEQQILLKEVQSKYEERLTTLQQEILHTSHQLQKATAELDHLKVENNMLRNQNEEKQEQVSEMFKKYASVRKSLRQLEQSSSSQSFRGSLNTDSAIVSMKKNINKKPDTFI